MNKIWPIQSANLIQSLHQVCTPCAPKAQEPAVDSTRYASMSASRCEVAAVVQWGGPQRPGGTSAKWATGLLDKATPACPPACCRRPQSRGRGPASQRAAAALQMLARMTSPHGAPGLHALPPQSLLPRGPADSRRGGCSSSAEFIRCALVADLCVQATFSWPFSVRKRLMVQWLPASSCAESVARSNERASSHHGV